jgi:hypothetical protein
VTRGGAAGTYLVQMRITDEIDYAASPEQVFAMLSDEDFQRRKCQATGALSSQVSVTVNGERTVIRTRRTMPTATFPDFVKSMVGDTLPLIQTDDWGPPAADGSRQGTLTVEVSGAPLGVTGTLALKPRGAGTVEHIECDLKARVPLFGSRIESAAVPAIRAGITVEQHTGQVWLRGT